MAYFQGSSGVARPVSPEQAGRYVSEGEARLLRRFGAPGYGQFLTRYWVVPPKQMETTAAQLRLAAQESNPVASGERYSGVWDVVRCVPEYVPQESQQCLVQYLTLGESGATLADARIESIEGGTVTTEAMSAAPARLVWRWRRRSKAARDVLVQLVEPLGLALQAHSVTFAGGLKETYQHESVKVTDYLDLTFDVVQTCVSASNPAGLPPTTTGDESDRFAVLKWGSEVERRYNPLDKEYLELQVRWHWERVERLYTNNIDHAYMWARLDYNTDPAPPGPTGNTLDPKWLETAGLTGIRRYVHGFWKERESGLTRYVSYRWTYDQCEPWATSARIGDESPSGAQLDYPSMFPI